MDYNKEGTILIVEDEEPIRKFIRINLERSSLTVFEAPSAEVGLETVEKEKIDIIILDVMLPGMDGFNVCRILRKKYPRIGIIMLTAKSQDADKIAGLEYGTDDYMVKPFNPLELVLRVKSLLRRMESTRGGKQEICEDGLFRMDIYSQKLFKNGAEIELTPTEYAIMKIFMENPGKAMSRDDILNMVWGQDFVGDFKIVDVNIRRLRSKIEDNPGIPEFIETIWGTGYRWRSRKII